MSTRPALLSTARGRLAGVTTAVLAATALSACQVTSPITTDLDYDPADGVSVDVGEVKIRDLLVVSEADGAAGVVSGLVINDGTDSVTVTLQLAGQAPLEPAVEVPAGGSVRLDGRDPLGEERSEPVVIPSVAEPAGAYLDLRVTTSAGEVTSTNAPVQPPDGPYSGYTPQDQAESTSG